MLYINGADITNITLGILNDDRSVFLIGPETVQAPPETFLSTINTFLCAHEQSWGDLSGIVAVLGPGSSTALRTSLTLVNTLAFVHQLPIFGVEIAQHADDRSALIALRGEHAIAMARPTYAHDARITVSTKDVLGRR